jgi:hypothetical protein
MNPDLTRLDYRELAKRYNLGSTQYGGDFVFIDGDLKLTRDHGLQLGDDTHSALHRLIVGWQYNAPTIKTLFDAVLVGEQKRVEYKNERGNLFRQLSLHDKQALDRWHELGHELGVENYGPATFAGAIMVVTSSLFQKERKDLNFSGDWRTRAPLFSGYSFAEIAEAAANNFRHFDEWAVSIKSPTDQQKKSIVILAAALGTDLKPECVNHPFNKNVCAKILTTLFSDFESFIDSFFACARSLSGI